MEIFKCLLTSHIAFKSKAPHTAFIIAPLVNAPNYHNSGDCPVRVTKSNRVDQKGRGEVTVMVLRSSVFRIPGYSG